MSKKNKMVNSLQSLEGYRVASSTEHLRVAHYFRKNYVAVKVYRDINYICMLAGFMGGVGGITVGNNLPLGIVALLLVTGVTGLFSLIIKKRLAELKEQSLMVSDKKYQVLDCSIYEARVYKEQNNGDDARDYYVKIMDSAGVKCDEELLVDKSIYKDFIKHKDVKHIIVKVNKQYYLVRA